MSLSLVDVRRSFGRRVVLRGVDLQVGPGQVAAITGPNGAGKTTLLRIAAGQLRHTGSLAVAGREVPEEIRQEVGHVPQTPAFWPSLTPREHLSFWAGLYKCEGVDDALAQAGLIRFNRPAGQMSRGQQQRLAIAMALLPQPKLVLLDEPWTALDAAGRVWAKDAVEEARRKGAAIVLVHHGEAGLAVDVRYRLEKGRLVEELLP